MTFPIRNVSWQRCVRIIPSRFPPIPLFERVADPEDWEALSELESLTNPRLRDEIGNISLVPPEDRISGPGTSAIMAAFTHLNPNGSRFSDGSYGVYYAAKNLKTAVAETAWHREKFLRATNEPAIEIDMRVYLADLNADMQDLCSQQLAHPELYDSENYAAPQALAKTLRNNGSDGIVYDSVRQMGGLCAAVFRPRLLSHCHQAQHLSYVWDGTQISNIYEKRALEL